jgi:hypothetical protein
MAALPQYTFPSGTACYELAFRPFLYSASDAPMGRIYRVGEEIWSVP